MFLSVGKVKKTKLLNIRTKQRRKMMVKSKKQDQADSLQEIIDELTLDLQRTRADFENYRKRVELEKNQIRDSASSTTILKLLPAIDNIERAISHLPEDLAENKWAQSVVALTKNLEKSLENLNLTRIQAANGTLFDPTFHEAIQMEEGYGDTEVIAEELQSGYMLNGTVIRHSMVKVKKENLSLNKTTQAE